MSDPVDALVGVVEHAREHGVEETARQLVAGARREPYDTRRTTALFVHRLLGHVFRGTPSLTEQPYGAIGQCDRCEMLVKVPREPGDGPGILGRAVERQCPCGRPRGEA